MSGSRLTAVTRAILIVLAVAALPACGFAAELFDRETVDFARRIDTTALSLLRVQYNARIAILDTLAREQLNRMIADEHIDGTSPAFAWMELYLNAGRYLNEPVISVRRKNLRKCIEAHLAGPQLEQFRRTHRVRPASLLDDEAKAFLSRLGRASAEQIARIPDATPLREALSQLAGRGEHRRALDRFGARYAAFLADGVLRVVPQTHDVWVGLETAETPATQPADRQAKTIATLRAIRDAWRRRNAAGVNELVKQLALAQVQHLPPGAAPPDSLGRLELLYNRSYKATVLWVGFAAAMVLMIVASASARRLPRRLGLTVLAASTLVLLVGFVVRWILSGRPWHQPPITNQFEAVTGSALLGAAVGIVLELIWKKNYFALAASFYATAALLSAFFLPERMSASITPQPGILNSPIMAAHVSVIIVGHAMAGMTFVISTIYLAVALKGLGPTPSSSPDLTGGGRNSRLAGIDRCNLIVAQLACWMVILGTMLGAYWADFAWGRWWGWDVKETWALITALVYVVILHVRFVTPPRRRGLVTAVCCIVGAGAMLFNWIVVNYLLPGLHSHA